MNSGYTSERARESDRAEVLAVLKTRNMHHIPSPEMATLGLESMFVARMARRVVGVVGVGGYRILGPGRGTTPLLAVMADLAGLEIGQALQEMRLKAMHLGGVKRVTTNADREPTIGWYRRHFGYHPVGTLKKFHIFGDPNVDEWTTLEMDLERCMDEKKER